MKINNDYELNLTKAFINMAMQNDKNPGPNTYQALCDMQTAINNYEAKTQDNTKQDKTEYDSGKYYSDLRRL